MEKIKSTFEQFGYKTVTIRSEFLYNWRHNWVTAWVLLKETSLHCSDVYYMLKISGSGWVKKAENEWLWLDEICRWEQCKNKRFFSSIAEKITSWRILIVIGRRERKQNNFYLPAQISSEIAFKITGWRGQYDGVSYTMDCKLVFIMTDFAGGIND